MSAVQTDFDRIALLLAEDGWTQNNHYHDFLLRHVPAKSEGALEIGCGTGGFSRRLAQHAQNVLALDLSPEMIRIARHRSAPFSNVEFQIAVAHLCNPGPILIISRSRALHRQSNLGILEKKACGFTGM